MSSLSASHASFKAPVVTAESPNLQDALMAHRSAKCTKRALYHGRFPRNLGDLIWRLDMFHLEIIASPTFNVLNIAQVNGVLAELNFTILDAKTNT
jgi:hypothetical protein